MGKQIAYKLIKTDSVLSHAPTVSMLVRDYEEKELEIDALVASGDCFAMLGSALDQLTAEQYEDDPKLIRPQLEKYVHTLLYLQRYYEIVPKPAEFRQ